MIRVGSYSYSGSVRYVSDTTIKDFFSGYSNGFEAFLYFCKGEFIYRSPNVDMVRFKYDPLTGCEIDWKEIYESNKKLFYDFSEELDKEFYNN